MMNVSLQADRSECSLFNRFDAVLSNAQFSSRTCVRVMLPLMYFAIFSIVALRSSGLHDLFPGSSSVIYQSEDAHVEPAHSFIVYFLLFLPGPPRSFIRAKMLMLSQPTASLSIFFLHHHLVL